MKSFTISQAAKKTDTSIDTIRFYEKEKLITGVSRRPSGYRQFDKNIIETIAFIRSAKELGFTLSEIKELIYFRNNPSAKAANIKEKALAKIKNINDKIKMLTKIRKELSALTKSCEGKGLASDCPILKGISNKTQE